MTAETESQVGECALCTERRPLRLSHIFPAFHFRKVKASGTGFMRKASQPNRRVQDGPKLRLLCATCEQHFSDDEQRFERGVYSPLLAQEQIQPEYDQYLYRFALSVLWRVALLNLVTPRPEVRAWVPALRSAVETWRLYLRPERGPVPTQQVHWILMESFAPQQVPVEGFVNYLATTTDGTIGCSANDCLVYAKMGVVLFLAPITPTDPALWENTQIHPEGGRIPTRARVLDPKIGAFIAFRARGATERLKGMSERQRQVIDNAPRPPDHERSPLLVQAEQIHAQSHVDPMIGRSRAPGRNEACPCGSGQKFKRCHGR